eukprot:12264960-Alexandrium_andersonii.AAC.1
MPGSSTRGPPRPRQRPLGWKGVARLPGSAPRKSLPGGRPCCALDLSPTSSLEKRGGTSRVW